MHMFLCVIRTANCDSKLLLLNNIKLTELIWTFQRSELFEKSIKKTMNRKRANMTKLVRILKSKTWGTLRHSHVNKTHQ